jgi:hypothetical protein
MLNYGNRILRLLYDLILRGWIVRIDNNGKMDIREAIVDTSDLISMRHINDDEPKYDARSLKTKISNLKKQIKHSKNTLEKKRLEKELNETYKEKKYGESLRIDDNAKLCI